LRKQMNVTTDKQFETLRTDFRAGIPNEGTIDKVDADKFLQLMAELGGKKLVGAAKTLPVGLFAELE
ncbi:MAG: ABC transporter substrate-binding protein, partial [Hyphomicrobiales bacterium]